MNIIWPSHTWRDTWPTLPPSMKSLRLSLFELWVITFYVSCHWKCVRGHCARAESRDPWVGDHKQVHFWNPRPRFAYSLYKFYWAPKTIKGRLLARSPMLKPFLVLGKNKGPNLRYWFRDPQTRFLGGTASFNVFFVKIGARVSAAAFLKNPPQKKIAESVCAEGREMTHAQNRITAKPIWIKSIWIKYHRRSYPHKFWWPSVEGFLGGGGQIPPFP